MLTEPKYPVYAIAASDWSAAADAGVQALPEPEAGAQEWQLWSYSPALVRFTSLAASNSWRDLQTRAEISCAQWMKKDAK